jgi:polyhydroxyalkanoate synthase
MLETIWKRSGNAAGAAVRALTLLSGATPHEVVWSSGPVRLRRYEPEERRGVPLLLVAPIINRYRVVDLEPGASLVGSLVERGIPVYLLDWGEPRRIDAGTDFEDYVLRYLPRACAAIPHVSPVDILGYCLGGTLAVLFAAPFPDRVRRLVTLCAPVDFGREEAHMDLMREWVQPLCFPVERLTRAFGNMPGHLIHKGFHWQRPLASALKYVRAWRRFDQPGYADRFLTLESWNLDGVDVPGAAYRRLIRDLYRENRLVQGTFELGGQRVDLARIGSPLLVVVARQDTTCPPAAALALLEQVSSARKETLELRGGHVTPVVGPQARERLHDPLADWLLG